jgi:hypothetical protein
VTGVFGRITTATPGEPCLLCRGEFNPVRAREEHYSDDERRALIDEGYAQGLDERDPAVVPYTTIVASHAVGQLLQRIFGFGDAPVAGKLLLRISDGEIRRQGRAPRDGCYCTKIRNLGRGDSASPLGMMWPS